MTDGQQFRGKAVLVTGGSRGIGAAVAFRFAALGAKVAIGYRAASGEADKLVEKLAASGAEAKAFAADVADPAAVDAMVRGAHDAFGRLDILVNAAGIGPYLPLDKIDVDHYRTIFDTNVLGTILLTKAAAPLLTSPGGRIVNFSSRLAYSPLVTSSVYSASKAAVVTLTHAFGKELGPRGITVNAIAPGVIETEMTTKIIAERGESIRAITPLGRIGQPDDIVGIVMFLTSDEARWITGRTIIADGGLN
jgi:3-oxoacyl-[acyl-carrier protein] reductase